MWRWLNEGLIVECLGREEDYSVRNEVLDQLDEIARAPFDPVGIETQTLPASLSRPERRLAWLAFGYLLTFRIHTNGPFPLIGRHIAVLDMRHETWLDPRHDQTEGPPSSSS